MPEIILVTGSEGFIGKALCSALTSDGYTVVRFSRSLGHDLLRADCFEPFHGKGVRKVIHLAGQSFIPDSWSNPSPFYELNVIGTQRTLDFCRRAEARMVFVSTYVYGLPVRLPVDERHPVAPINPYTHSRWLAEEVCRFYHASFSIPVSIIRPFNIFGPGQSSNFLIPRILEQWRAGQDVVVNDLRPRRDYLYIDDFVEAVRKVLALEETLGVYNVGRGSSISVEGILKELEKISGAPLKWSSRNIERRDEIADIVAGCQLVSRGIWTPTIDFGEGLRRMLGAP